MNKQAIGQTRRRDLRGTPTFRANAYEILRYDPVRGTWDVIGGRLLPEQDRPSEQPQLIDLRRALVSAAA
jgi:hypothetical protein